MVRRLAFLLLAMMFWPAVACGSQRAWPLAGPGEVVVDFGGLYTSGAGTERTHHGLDIAGDPGSDILSCIDGIVTFAGSIPAGEGASTLAVTVRRDDGVLVTCLPLQELAVTKGETVLAADRVGTLAAAGDASSPSAHVHVSCRVGEDYVDPGELLVAQGVPQGSPQPEVPAVEVSGAAAAEQLPILGEVALQSVPAVAVSVLDPGASSVLGEHGALLGGTELVVAGANRCAVDLGSIRDALGDYVARAEDVRRSHPDSARIARPDWGALWLAVPLVLAALAKAGSRYVETSLSAASRPGESEVAAAVGR